MQHLSEIRRREVRHIKDNTRMKNNSALTRFVLFFLASDIWSSFRSLGSLRGSSAFIFFHVCGFKYHAPYLNFTQLGSYWPLPNWKRYRDLLVLMKQSTSCYDNAHQLWFGFIRGFLGLRLCRRNVSWHPQLWRDISKFHYMNGDWQSRFGLVDTGKKAGDSRLLYVIALSTKSGYPVTKIFGDILYVSILHGERHHKEKIMDSRDPST